jgi:hypothetical protein
MGWTSMLEVVEDRTTAKPDAGCGKKGISSV